MATRSTQTVVQVLAKSHRVLATQVVIQVLGTDSPPPEPASNTGSAVIYRRRRK